MPNDSDSRQSEHERQGREKARRTLLPRESARPVLGFLLRFVLAWVVALGAATLFPRIEDWAIAGTLWNLGWILKLIDRHSMVTGTHIMAAGAALQIVPDCTPLMPTAALWAAVLAFPAPWRWRLLGLAGGAVVIWFYNIARILALVPVLAFKPQWFEFIHVYLWQTVTLIVVFMCFFLWLRFQPAASRVAR